MTGTDDKKIQHNTFKQWFATTDLIFLEVLLLITLIVSTKESSLIVLSLITILYIVFGEDVEEVLKTAFKLDSNNPKKATRTFFQIITLGSASIVCRLLRDDQNNITYRKEGSREWVASILLGIVLFLLDFIELNSVKNVIVEKWEIIGLIMSFALMSYGIGKSGYFKYAAYRITESCDGSTTRLTLYLFVLTSALTLITSNDIVILVLTPIIIQIAYYAGIKNAKLLLLSQFVAANTLSMGLLIGSPTNLIFGLKLEYGFLDYIWLMIVPTILAFMISFIVVHALNKRNANKKSNLDWSFSDRYRLPTIDKKQNYTKEMTYWVWAFALVILLVTITTSIEGLRLGYTIPGVILAVVVIYATSGGSHNKQDHIREHLWESIKGLPFQIIPFALIFFVVTKELGNTNLVNDIGNWVVSSDSYFITTLKSLLVSGGLVNLFNDLPAADLLAKMAILNPDIAGNDMVARALLVGLNIGCYVTPVGALAGIIWFHQMKDETQKIKNDDPSFNIQTPIRSGLFKYGLIHFFVVTLSLSVILPSLSHLYTASITDWNCPTYQKFVHDMWVYETIGGLLLTFIIMFKFNDILQKNNVVLGDMRVFLGFMTWANARNQEHSIATFILFFIIIITLFTTPIFLAEEWGMRELIWIPNMIGGGFDFVNEDDYSMIPKSTIGVILMGILPLASIALLVKLISTLGDNKKLENISLQMATGEIQSHRVVMFMDTYKEDVMEFINNILKNKNDVFVLILIYSDDKTEVQEFLNRNNLDKESYDDYYIGILPKNDVADVVSKFDIEKADEVYLFSQEEMSKTVANSLQTKLLINGQLKLKNRERYPKIFSLNGIFDNNLIKEKYVINLPSNKIVFEKLEKTIYDNNLEHNNYDDLSELVKLNS